LYLLRQINDDLGWPADIKKDLQKQLSDAVHRYARARKFGRVALENLELEVTYGVKI